jgi:hypothetical protein
LLGVEVFIVFPSWRRAFFSGLILGFGTLVKAQIMFLPGFLLGIYGYQTRAASGFLHRLGAIASMFAIGMALIILPWTARNEILFHNFILVSTNGGMTFLAGNNPEARGDNTPENSLAPLVSFSIADQVAADKRAWALGWNWIVHNPIRFIELIPMKIWRLWAPDGEGEWWYQLGFSHYYKYAVAFRVARVLNQAFYGAMLVGFALAVIRLARGAGDGLPWATLGLSIALYVTMVSVVFSGQSRLHFPVVPWVFTYVGWVLGSWVESRLAMKKGPASVSLDQLTHRIS